MDFSIHNHNINSSSRIPESSRKPDSTENDLREVTPSAGVYDSVSIHGSAPESDSLFIRSLARSEAAAIDSGVDARRVAELHQQVQSGTYHVDAARIAERMLGYRTDSERRTSHEDHTS